jgi:NADPH:quinone reductase-like Zn-dependent oxidoreductase
MQPHNTSQLLSNDRQLSMQAMVQSEYGSPDVLRLQAVDKPTVSDHGVLMRVRAASINAGDWHLMRGAPWLIRPMFGGLRQPKIKILGFDVAGEVEAVGPKVTQFKPGDQVFGDLSACGFGGFAEYVCAAETALVLKPAAIPFEAAAAVPGAGLAALQGLREGGLQPGQQVLINGAAGGVGSFAVQIAKAFGAEVTASCSPEKMEMVRSLGADHVIGYVQAAAPRPRHRYDLVLDAAAYRPVFDYLPGLRPQGSYILVGGATSRLFQVLLLGRLISSISRRQVKCLASKPNLLDLLALQELMVAGKIYPFIDQRYSLSQVPAALRQLEARQLKGKAIICL